MRPPRDPTATDWPSLAQITPYFRQLTWTAAIQRLGSPVDLVISSAAGQRGLRRIFA